MSIGCLLHPKKWVFGFKRGKFWNFQNSRPSSLLRLWRPYYASPRPGRCLWAERTSRRWFWVLNGLCATSGSRDMGRQSFLEENQKFKKMHFSFLPFESILVHLYSLKWYSEAPIDLIWKYSSLWVILGVFDKKKLILSPNKAQRDLISPKYGQERPI